MAAEPCDSIHLSYDLTYRNGASRTAMELAVEKNFDYTVSQEWMRNNWTVSVWISLAYLVFLMCSQKYMQKRPAMKLDKPLVAWNGLLTIFSVLGTVKTFPEFFQSIRDYGVNGSMCYIDDFYNGISGFWMWLFTLSKICELGDTVFLVLRKRPVIFLHYYHHVATLIYAWYSYPFQYGSCRWGMWMNYAVHSFMYCYYWLRSLKVSLPRYSNMCVTIAQISQMAVGSYACFFVFCACAMKWVSVAQCYCEDDTTVYVVNTAMYLSYLVLFVQLFCQSYVVGKKVVKRE